VLREAVAVGAVLLAVYAFGHLRIALYEGRDKETLTVAAVDHDASGFSLLPAEARPYAVELQAENLRLTSLAAQAGAKLAGWMEGATVVFPEDEEAWKNRLGTLAREEGIGPIHTQMTAFRAVENGHAILRPTSAGLSAAASPVGRVLAQRSDFDTGPGFLITDVPTRKLPTVYTAIGEWAVLVPVLLAAVFAWVGRPRRERAAVE
jgi:hypothetical protein